MPVGVLTDGRGRSVARPSIPGSAHSHTRPSDPGREEESYQGIVCAVSAVRGRRFQVRGHGGGGAVRGNPSYRAYTVVESTNRRKTIRSPGRPTGSTSLLAGYNRWVSGDYGHVNYVLPDRSEEERERERERESSAPYL